jgi:Ser/Thr protein kinase RdoA (MazF antagonist)
MQAFESLTPDRVMDLVEDVLQVEAEPVCRPLASYINRVYEVELADGSAVVVKFYRPGRWTVEALEEEHAFVYDLQEAEIPVVAPLTDDEGSTLFEEEEDLWCCIMPRQLGRPFEEPRNADWQELGRTLARVHAAGDLAVPEHRLTWHPDEASEGHLDTILDLLDGPPDSKDRFEDAALDLIDLISPVFDEEEFTRLHGDLHANNLLRRPGTAGLWLIDFDDMVYGPPVQDLWMLLPGLPADCPRELELLLSGYRQFRPFRQDTLQWIEPLRAMRFLHFNAWLALQRHDNANRVYQDTGSDLWWRTETAQLLDQLSRIQDVI